MRTRKSLFCGCLLLAAADAGANNITWIKDADGSWAVASNWSSNPALPGAGDDVTINVAGDRLITLSGGGTQTIKSLVSAERLLITNSSLSISTTLQISNTLTLSDNASIQGGTYTATGGAALTVYRGALTGGVTANAPISVPGVTGGQLTVSGGLTLNDTLSLGDGNTSYYYANLAFGGSADQTLAGTGSVVFNTGNLYAPSGAGTLTVAPGITVRGRNGYVFGNAVVNQGTIAADGADQRIDLQPTTFTNRGAMSARNGGFLSVGNNWTNAAGASVTAAGGSILHLGTGSYPWSNAGTITATDSTVYLGGSFTQAGLGNFVRSGGAVYVTGALSGGLALNAASGSWTLISNGSLAGGTYTASGGAGLTVYRGSLTGGVTANAPISVPGFNGGQLTVSGGLTLNDTLSLGDGGKSYYGNLAFGGSADQTLAGTGSVVFNAGNLFAPSGAGTLTIGPGITVRGKNGTIAGGAVVNQGTIAADGADQRIDLQATTFTNRGAMSARNGGLLSVGYNFTNAAGASVTAAAGSTLYVGGGSYPWSNAGTITATDSTVYLGGSFTQAGLGSLTRMGGTITVRGTISGDFNLNATTGSWNIDGGTLRDGTYSATAGSVLLVQSRGITLNNATIAAGSAIDLTVQSLLSSQANASIANNLTLNGTMTVGTSTVNASIATKTSVSSITGTGSISFVNATIRNTQGTFTIGDGITLHGERATISNDASTGSIINAGTISADTGTITIGGTNGTFVNQGTLDADGGFVSVSEGKMTNQGTLSARAGTLQLGAAVQLDMRASSKLVVAGSGTMKLSGHSGTAATLDVSGGVLQVGATSAGSAVLTTRALAITGGGKLDLANNRLVVDYDPAASSPIGSVRAALVSGYANGAWNGPGIDSVGIAAGRSLGYAEAGDVLGAAGGSFGGTTVDGSAVLVRYTLSGDATLDGVVDFNDLVSLAQNYNTTLPATGSGWYRGDFNYDGTVDFNDLVKLAQNYNVALPSEPIAGAPTDFASDLAAAFANVPEPSALSLLAAGVLLAGRRRRQTV